MESRHCGQDKRIFFCPVHNASTPCSLQAFGIRCIVKLLFSSMDLLLTFTFNMNSSSAKQLPGVGIICPNPHGIHEHSSNWRGGLGISSQTASIRPAAIIKNGHVPSSMISSILDFLYVFKYFIKRLKATILVSFKEGETFFT